MIVVSVDGSDDVDCIHRYVCFLCSRPASGPRLSAYPSPPEAVEIFGVFGVSLESVPTNKHLRIGRWRIGWSAWQGSGPSAVKTMPFAAPSGLKSFFRCYLAGKSISNPIGRGSQIAAHPASQGRLQHPGTNRIPMPDACWSGLTLATDRR